MVIISFPGTKEQGSQQQNDDISTNPNLVQKLIGNPIIYFSTLIKGLKTDLMQFSHCALESGLLGT